MKVQIEYTEAIGSYMDTMGHIYDTHLLRVLDSF